MELNDYSAHFLTALLRAFPEFGDLFVPGPEPGCFTLQFLNSAGAAVVVFIEEGERITICFDDSHVHFGGWFNSIDDVDFANAIDFIRTLKNSKPGHS